MEHKEVERGHQLSHEQEGTRLMVGLCVSKLTATYGCEAISMSFAATIPVGTLCTG